MTLIDPTLPGEGLVTVTDGQAPSITNANASPAVVPADGALHVVTISYDLFDNCGTATALLSSEAGVEIVDATHVRVRGELPAGSTERQYAITITATEATAVAAVRRARRRSPRRRTSAGESGVIGAPPWCARSRRESRIGSGVCSGMVGSRVTVEIGVEEDGESGAAAGEAGLDRPFGDADLAGDRLHGQVAEVVEDERLALGVRQLPQCGHQGDPGLVDRVGLRGVQRGEVAHADIYKPEELFGGR